MTHIPTNIIAFAFALGVIIFVHEAGHLLVAKAFGVRVLTFSLGFGKSLWSFRRGETEYRVSVLPLGGYVRLSGETAEEATDDPRDFQNKPRWQRILVFIAGPAMNVFLAVFLLAALFTVGIAVPNFTVPPVVGGIEAGSSAATAGIQRGDRILAVNGDPVGSWPDIELRLAPGKPANLTLDRAGRTLPATVTPGKLAGDDAADMAGMFAYFRPQITAVNADAPAAVAGFRSGDEIRAVDGRAVLDSEDFVRYIQARAGKPIAVQVMRDNAPRTLTVVPRLEGTHGVIGVGVGYYQRFGPGRAVIESVQLNIYIVKSTFQAIGKIFTREVSARRVLSGPIGIAAQAGAAARVGFKELLYLMGLLSISIAVLNLLPIPILDGGQIFIISIEGILRRDLSVRFKEVVTQVGFVLILTLMAVVIWFDLSKWWQKLLGS